MPQIDNLTSMTSVKNSGSPRQCLQRNASDIAYLLHCMLRRVVNDYVCHYGNGERKAYETALPWSPHVRHNTL